MLQRKIDGLMHCFHLSLNKYRDLPADKGKLKGQCLSYIGGAMSIYNIYWLELNENESHL